MPRDWEAQFREWAKPPGKTEQERCDNAASSIRNAIKESDKLRARNISVFTHGSYRNNTNVRKDSDVDIGILCTDIFFHGPLPEGIKKESLGFSDATYHYEQYKNEVEEALVDYFGRSAVKRGNKAFDVHETSYHVEADVAAFFEHRRYLSDGTYLEGVELRTDKEARRVINWPEQHYENGVSKNKQTGSRFKSIVRVLKALSNQMTEQNVRAGDVPGFLIECLVWNVPNEQFQHSTYTSDVRAALAFLFNNTMTHEKCKEWGEVSELIYLFNPVQKWTWKQAHAFTSAAWDYVGFED
ncbi:MAG TPA: nucleotidyltransferase [Sedimentisphaerales bacterium]|nr:nucleotidyltransferase [Sedimentisphaerales bacterium]